MLPIVHICITCSPVAGCKVQPSDLTCWSDRLIRKDGGRPALPCPVLNTMPDRSGIS